jgi:hypothetical protein
MRTPGDPAMSAGIVCFELAGAGHDEAVARLG